MSDNTLFKLTPKRLFETKHFLDLVLVYKGLFRYTIRWTYFYYKSICTYIAFMWKAILI